MAKQKTMWKSKTLWGSITAIVGAAAAYATGEVDLTVAIQIAVPALLAIFIRSGVQKVINK